MRTIKEVIEILNDKSETRHPGKMGYECYVDKELLGEASIYLQYYLDILEQNKQQDLDEEKKWETLIERMGVVGKLIAFELLNGLLIQVEKLPTWRLGPDDCVQKYKVMDIIYGKIKEIKGIK